MCGGLHDKGCDMQQPLASMPKPLIDLAVVKCLDFKHFRFHFGHSIWHHMTAFVILIVFSHFGWKYSFRRRSTNFLLQLYFGGNVY